MKKTFYRSGEQLSVQGRGQSEGMQKITTLKPNGLTRCPKTGCQRYEQGYSVTLNLADPEDATLHRFIREGKVGRYLEEIITGVEGLRKITFPPGRCPGHWPWENPTYIVGERKTTRDEWHSRYVEGGEALVQATKRALEMSGKE